MRAQGKTYSVQCSNCGRTGRWEKETMTRCAAAALEDGWRSYGSALYCPECCRTWHERNKSKELSPLLTSMMEIEEHMEWRGREKQG